MDLQSYYKNMREHETAITDEYPIVVSHATGDGGIAGRMTEVTKRIAARLIVEGMARLASILEASSFKEAQQEARKAAEDLAANARLQLAAMAAAEVQKLTQAAAAAVLATKE